MHEYCKEKNAVLIDTSYFETLCRYTLMMKCKWNDVIKCLHESNDLLWNTTAFHDLPEHRSTNCIEGNPKINKTNNGGLPIFEEIFSVIWSAHRYHTRPIFTVSPAMNLFNGRKTKIPHSCLVGQFLDNY